MSETADSEKKNRQELKNKRNQLYKLFVNNPMYTELAIEIKVLDDQLAACDQPGFLVQEL